MAKGNKSNKSNKYNKNKNKNKDKNNDNVTNWTQVTLLARMDKDMYITREEDENVTSEAFHILTQSMYNMLAPLDEEEVAKYFDENQDQICNSSRALNEKYKEMAAILLIYDSPMGMMMNEAKPMDVVFAVFDSSYGWVRVGAKKGEWILQDCRDSETGERKTEGCYYRGLCSKKEMPKDEEE